MFKAMWSLSLIEKQYFWSKWNSILVAEFMCACQKHLEILSNESGTKNCFECVLIAGICFALLMQFLLRTDRCWSWFSSPLKSLPICVWFLTEKFKLFHPFWKLNPLSGMLSAVVVSFCRWSDIWPNACAGGKKAVIMEGHWTSWKRIKGSKHLIRSFSAANIYFLNGEVAMKYPCVNDLLKSFHGFNFFNVTLVMEHKEERFCISMVDFWPLLF